DGVPGASASGDEANAGAGRGRRARDRDLSRAARTAPPRRAARMIACLRGQLRGEDDEAIIIDVGGVGYQVLPSAATKAALRPGEVQLHIHAHFVSDEPLRLYGFSTTPEKSLFQTLI